MHWTTVEKMCFDGILYKTIDHFYLLKASAPVQSNTWVLTFNPVEKNIHVYYRFRAIMLTIIVLKFLQKALRRHET